LFLIYNQKYYYASSLNKLDQVCWLALRTVAEHEAKCSFIIALHLLLFCALHKLQIFVIKLELCSLLRLELLLIYSYILSKNEPRVLINKAYAKAQKRHNTRRRQRVDNGPNPKIYARNPDIF